MSGFTFPISSFIVHFGFRTNLPSAALTLIVTPHKITNNESNKRAMLAYYT